MLLPGINHESWRFSDHVLKEENMSQSENSIKYDKTNTKRVYIKLNKNTDKDILDYLDSISNKQGYIKELIRKDMKPR